LDRSRGRIELVVVLPDGHHSHTGAARAAFLRGGVVVPGAAVWVVSVLVAVAEVEPRSSEPEPSSPPQAVITMAVATNRPIIRAQPIVPPRPTRLKP
jgi:hypothetical protein